MPFLDSGSQKLDLSCISVDVGFQKVCFSGFRIPRPGFWILKSRFRIPQANVPWILDSTSKYSLDSGFHKQMFLGFRIPRANVSWNPNSTSKCFLDSGFHKKMFLGFRIPRANVSCNQNLLSLHGATFTVRLIIIVNGNECLRVLKWLTSSLIEILSFKHV